MANAGMDLKSLQYLMGHSDASVTLNVYTHNSYEKAEESMAQIVAFSGGKTKQETGGMNGVKIHAVVRQLPKNLCRVT